MIAVAVYVVVIDAPVVVVVAIDAPVVVVVVSSARNHSEPGLVVAGKESVVAEIVAAARNVVE